MSSLIRRMQIRAMQERGYVRTKYVLVENPNGAPRQKAVSSGGLILSSDNSPVGYHWPRFLARTPDPAKPAKPKTKRPPRGSRRGKPSKWRRAA